MSSVITLKDRFIIETALKKLDCCLSEYSFANLFLFREVHSYELQGDFIKGKTREGVEFWMPLKFPFKLEPGKSYFPIPERWLDQFPEAKFEEKEADQDYLFSREKMNSLAGRKLSAQRNFLYRFEEEYDPEVRALDKNGSYEVLKSWASQNSEERDEGSCKEAIDLLEELGLFGYTVFSGNEPMGFIIGEQIRENEVVCHFAKAKNEIKGITPYMYHNFAKRLDGKIEWVNLEQDLGLTGLRKSKSAYHPDKMLKKYYIKL